MYEEKYFHGSKNPANIIRSISYDVHFSRNNPDYFDPSGIICFFGCQGSGKTLSAVRLAKSILKDYPKAKICSNLDIHGLDRDIIPFEDYEQLHELSNGIHGIIFLIDEIHVLWNSLESKNIPFSDMAVFCQMRKERRLIIGTSQVYSRVAKPIREQLRLVVKCRTICKYIQINELIDPNPEGSTGEKDGQLDGELIRTDFFFHSPEDYQAYDTYNKISRLSRGSSSSSKGGVYT